MNEQTTVTSGSDSVAERGVRPGVNAAGIAATVGEAIASGTGTRLTNCGCGVTNVATGYGVIVAACVDAA